MSLPLLLGIVATDISQGDGGGAMCVSGVVGGKTKNASCSELGEGQCSQRGSPSVRSWREFCPGLIAVGRGKMPGPTTRLQSVSECEARQIPADPCRSSQTPTDRHRCPQIPAGPDRFPQMPAGPDRSPLFSTVQAENLYS